MREGRRIRTLLRHVSADASANDIDTLPLPPEAYCREGTFFPTMAHLKEDAGRLGEVFRYKFFGGRHITVLSNPNLFDIVFKPNELSENEEIGDSVKMEMDKIAFAWFGIPKECGPYTREGLNEVRKQLTKSSRPGGFNDRIAHDLYAQFANFPDEGEIDAFALGASTFWPVNGHLYGCQTINPQLCPHAQEWFHQFDAPLPAVTGGVPKSQFPEHLDAAEKITDLFFSAIQRGVHLSNDAPVFKARVGVLANDPQITDRTRARFMLSLFWAAQANTLPLTFWLIVEILNNPRVREKVAAEARSGPFSSMPDESGHFDVSVETLPYIRACLKEVLRMKVAMLTHRKVSRDTSFTTPTGKRYKLPKGDMVTVASYISHYDETVYQNPWEFNPERWLDPAMEKLSPLDSTGDDYWYPFSKGRYSCSGKFLALLEIPTLIALFMREFDAELVDPMPSANWQAVLAAVLPEGTCKLKFRRKMEQ